MTGRGHAHTACPGPRCYACTVDVTGRFRGDRSMDRSFTLYEAVVEHVESLPPGAVFTSADVVRALGGGFRRRSMTSLAFTDMRLHGVITCVGRDRAGRCRGYRRVD